MNFDFSAEQKSLRDGARRFLADRCPPTAVRRILDGPEPFDRALWRGLAELGYTGTAIAEDQGGVGLGSLELCVIAEELGRALAPTPFASSIYLAAEAIKTFGSAPQQARWLPKLADGSIIGTLALAEGPRAPTPEALQTRFDGAVLSGTKTPVADGDVADVAIVAVAGGGLVLVDLGANGVTRAPVDTIDPTRSHATISFERTPAEMLGAATDGWRDLQAIFDRAAVLIAFEQLGGAQACLEAGRDYALTRHAFGRPIGSFQAIKHKLADVYVAVELARSNAYYAAWALASGAAELPVAAAAARVAASEAYLLASRENIQVHGGMGYTWAFDCHLHYRRAKLLALALGSPRAWRDKLIARLEARNATAA